MVTIDEVTGILNDSPLAFKFSVVIGIVLIIIAVAPSISIPILKSTITLSKRQSVCLGIVGGILIISGLTALSQMSNDLPTFQYCSISPYNSANASENGTLVQICVEYYDPDENRTLPKLFDRVKPLQYDFSLIGPGTNNSVVHVQGPGTENLFTWLVYPDDAGENFITINVTDRSPEDRNTKWISYKKSYSVKPLNQPPKITEFKGDAESPQYFNSKIMFTVKAVDPENNKLYYKFLRSPPDSENFSIVMKDWSEENMIIWRPKEDAMGVNYIMARVSDEQDKNKRNGELDHEILRYEIKR